MNEKYLHHTVSGNKLLLLTGSGNEYRGVFEMLTENHILFDVMEHWRVTDGDLPRDLSDYQVIILPGIERMSEEAPGTLVRLAGPAIQNPNFAPGDVVNERSDNRFKVPDTWGTIGTMKASMRASLVYGANLSVRTCSTRSSTQISSTTAVHFLTPLLGCSSEGCSSVRSAAPALPLLDNHGMCVYSSCICTDTLALFALVGL